MRLEAVSHEALLQASRRVDWRFLLPEPDLRRVACLAGSDPELVESLLLFSEELHLVESLSGAEVEPPYDLVVLANPSRDALHACSGLLSPAGWVYLEVDGSLRGRLRHPSHSAQGYGRALRKLGFVDVATYAHWPDFESCRAIVPLDDAAAVRHGLARGRIKGPRMLTRFAPALATLRQLALFVPCASALGRRPPLAVEESR
jgi:hypothetical protein